MKYPAVIAILFLGFTALASADIPTKPYKVLHDNMWGYANNWNDPGNTMKTTFSDGQIPAMNVTFNTNITNLPLGYPALIRGWHYNLSPIPNDTALPQQVSKLSKIPVKFAYSQSGSKMAGIFTYSMLLRKDSSKTTPELDVRIWGDHNSSPVGNQSATYVITAGGRNFDLWEGQNSGGYYVYTFVPHGTVAYPGKNGLASKGSLNLDVKLFFYWLQKYKASEGHFSDDMYLDSVEVGFEIVAGEGYVYITGNIDVV